MSALGPLSSSSEPGLNGLDNLYIPTSSLAICFSVYEDSGPSADLVLAKSVTVAGPAPTILDWYGHCMRLSVNKLGRSGGMLPQENF